MEVAPILFVRKYSRSFITWLVGLLPQPHGLSLEDPVAVWRSRGLPGKPQGVQVLVVLSEAWDSSTSVDLVAAAEDLLDALLLVWGEVRADDLAPCPPEVLCYLFRVVALHQGEDRRVAGLYRV